MNMACLPSDGAERQSSEKKLFRSLALSHCLGRGGGDLDFGHPSPPDRNCLDLTHRTMLAATDLSLLSNPTILALRAI